MTVKEELKQWDPDYTEELLSLADLIDPKDLHNYEKELIAYIRTSGCLPTTEVIR